MIGVLWLFSSRRSDIDWRTVGVGLALQVLIGVSVLYIPGVKDVLQLIADFFVNILGYTAAGSEFLFGGLVKDMDSFGYIFAFQVLPVIVFFAALSSLLYYFGILQVIVRGLAWVMRKTLGLTGAESLAAAANVFIGQTEAPLIIKPYLEHMSRSEILCLMTGGMATIAGSVFAAYVGFLGGDDLESQQLFARHLLTASLMSAPAAIVAAKILEPSPIEDTSGGIAWDVSNLDSDSVALAPVDTDKTPSILPKEEAYPEVNGNEALTAPTGFHETEDSNVLDAITRGTTDGLRLAVNVAAMLLVFTALMFMVNSIFLSSTDGVNSIVNYFTGEDTDWNAALSEATDGRFQGFSFTYLIGVIFAPVAWLLGVANDDLLVVGQLLGQKTVINEFYAYSLLTGELRDSMDPTSLLIVTYALCGFANFASIGIQIGGISAIAPGQRRTLSAFGLKALLGGTIACFLTAGLAGVLIRSFGVG